MVNFAAVCLTGAAPHGLGYDFERSRVLPSAIALVEVQEYVYHDEESAIDAEEDEDEEDSLSDTDSSPAPAANAIDPPKP